MVVVVLCEPVYGDLNVDSLVAEPVDEFLQGVQSLDGSVDSLVLPVMCFQASGFVQKEKDAEVRCRLTQAALVKARDDLVVGIVCGLGRSAVGENE